MHTLEPSGGILHVYQTGDRPVTILCSDSNHYICKFKHPGEAANKLVSEMIGSTFARLWRISTPAISLITNDPVIWLDSGISHDLTAPLLGSRKMENVCDLSNMNADAVALTRRSLDQLLWIALFDMWIVNEDRTYNNYNLLYDLKKEEIVSIDYGGIFNSGIMHGPVYQLNDSDSIIQSSLFDRLKSLGLAESMMRIAKTFKFRVEQCRRSVPGLLHSIPESWEVDIARTSRKLNELFREEWVQETWQNFTDIANRY